MHTQTRNVEHCIFQCALNQDFVVDVYSPAMVSEQVPNLAFVGSELACRSERFPEIHPTPSAMTPVSQVQWIMTSRGGALASFLVLGAI